MLPRYFAVAAAAVAAVAAATVAQPSAAVAVAPASVRVRRRGPRVFNCQAELTDDPTVKYYKCSEEPPKFLLLSVRQAADSAPPRPASSHWKNLRLSFCAHQATHAPWRLRVLPSPLGGLAGRCYARAACVHWLREVGGREGGWQGG